MDAPTFRQDFPEFADTTAYPNGTVNFYLGLGVKLLPADRWQDVLDYGLELFTAHHLAIATRDQQTAAIGGVPGVMTGPQTSKTVDKVSVSYDTNAATYEDAGFWNMSSYGVRFWQLARMVGAGGVQL